MCRSARRRCWRRAGTSGRREAVRASGDWPADRAWRRARKWPGSTSTGSRRLPASPAERHRTGIRSGMRGAVILSRAPRHRPPGPGQVVDLVPVLAAVVTEYRLLSKTCACCGVVSTADWTAADDVNAEVVASAGSPVRIGPRVLAMCALLTCGHYLPVGRATALLETLTGLHLATGFTARARRRAAKKLTRTFLPHMKDLLATAPVLHADETTGRAAGALAYVHVACTEYLTLLHVGGRSSKDIDNGGVLKDFTGVLVRDGYAGYDHLPAIHAWCGAHLIRDLRSVSDADPAGQLWATAMADTLTTANQAACLARSEGRDRLDPDTLATVINHYLGALAKGTTDNLDHTGELADKARTLIRRFRRYQDMILRFATDLSVPWTNNQAERDVRPVKIQQRNGGGCWRTLQGLTEFAVVHSYLSTATKLKFRSFEAVEHRIAESLNEWDF